MHERCILLFYKRTKQELNVKFVADASCKVLDDCFEMEPSNSYENSKNIIKSPDLEYTPKPGGLGKAFFLKMQRYGNTIAQIDGLTGEKDTYTSLLQRCIRTAITMRSKGITSQDIITICSFNHLNSCVPFIAASFLDVKTANLDPTISLPDTIFLLKQVCPKMIFVGVEAIQLMEDALRESQVDATIVVFGNSDTHLQFGEFLEASVEENDFRPVEVENDRDTALIFFSSGTTGLPKGICINHYALLSQAFAFRNTGYNVEIFLAFASMYWISSALIITGCIMSKGSRVVVPKYDPATVWNLLDTFKVTSMFLAPTQAVSMYKRGRPKGIDISNFGQLMIGGGPLSKEQMEAIRDVLPSTNVMLGYGLTEVTGMATIFQPKFAKDMILVSEKPGSAGRPVAGFSYKVVDLETEEILGLNQKGELRVKTDFQMNGYYNLDSSDAWDADGWLKTGDVCYYDEDLCFFIVDRVKEMLKFQSWHVPPAQLEGILLTHPAIESAVVVGLPHPEDGDHPVGVVVLKKYFVGVVSEKDIERYVEERVHHRMRLRGGVRTIGSLPLTPTGKIKRRDIRDMILRGEL